MSAGSFARFATQVRPYRPIMTWALWSVSLVAFTNDKLVEIMSIQGPSMTPTLSPDYTETGAMDYILLRKYRPAADLKHGDIISFWTPHKQDHLSVKRVIGLSGDTVYLDPKRRPNVESARGEKAARDWDIMAYWDWEGSESTRDISINRPCVKVPYGHVWVEGDNWRSSADSNYYGPVSKSLISGKAVCLVRPFSRLYTTPWVQDPNTTQVKHGKALAPVQWRE